MKRLFSVIISKSTVFFSKLFGRKQKDSTPTLQETARMNTVELKGITKCLR